jgi:hypothetical protein
MGAAIGMCPKARIFSQYIEMEMSLREFDRARTLYQKYLEVSFGESTPCVLRELTRHGQPTV